MYYVLHKTAEGKITASAAAAETLVLAAADALDALVDSNSQVDADAVAQAAVIGTPDERMGQVGKAFVVREGGGPAIEESELIGWCKQRMAGYKVPRSIVFLEALPLGATGKVMKDRLE